eukprot:1775373-Amphidinium_carterae.1
MQSNAQSQSPYSAIAGSWVSTILCSSSMPHICLDVEDDQPKGCSCYKPANGLEWNGISLDTCPA